MGYALTGVRIHSFIHSRGAGASGKGGDICSAKCRRSCAFEPGEKEESKKGEKSPSAATLFCRQRGASQKQGVVTLCCPLAQKRHVPASEQGYLRISDKAVQRQTLLPFRKRSRFI